MAWQSDMAIWMNFSVGTRVLSDQDHTSIMYNVSLSLFLSSVKWLYVDVQQHRGSPTLKIEPGSPKDYRSHNYSCQSAPLNTTSKNLISHVKSLRDNPTFVGIIQLLNGHSKRLFKFVSTGLFLCTTQLVHTRSVTPVVSNSLWPCWLYS